MNTTTNAASTAARHNETNLMVATVTKPPNEWISKPDSATCTSGPNIWFNSCAITSASPNVANSDVNRSLPMTRRMTVT